jgi:hypothetical protein
MVEDLSIDNVLSEEQIDSLFIDDNTEEETSEDVQTQTDNNDKTDTTEVDVDSIFIGKPESVGSEEDNKDEEDTTSNKGTSPNQNFYSSIANALEEEGIFPDLDKELIAKVKTAEDFRNLIDEQIKAGLEEKQKRVNEALGVGVEPDTIRQYEATIDYLNSLSEDIITAESEEGDTIRQKLIYQDLINRGYSDEQAKKKVERSFKAGTDVDDAKEALEENKQFFKKSYESLIAEKKNSQKNREEELQQRTEKLKKSILEDRDIFGGININKDTRNKVIDNISKPVYRDPKTGKYLTALQKYEQENGTDFIKNVGILFTLTDGFKNIDALVKDKVTKEVKKGLKELEHTLNNTVRNSDGSLKYTSGVGSDSNSFIGKGMVIDV